MYIKWFSEISKDAFSNVGEKALNLAILTQKGFQVPKGFVVCGHAFTKFLQESGLTSKIAQKIQLVRLNDSERIEQISKEIQELIKDSPIPLDVMEEIMDNYELFAADTRLAHNFIEAKDVFTVVRSSLTHEALIGKGGSFSLNIKGSKDVVYAVRDCWASLFTAKTITLMHEHNRMVDKIPVIIQEMVRAEKAGKLFTINPETNQEDEVIVQAIHGLGEPLVRSQVQGDYYVISKQTRWVKQVELKEQSWGLFRNEVGKLEKVDIPVIQHSKRVLHDGFLAELARIGKRVEEELGGAQYIDWAIEGNQVFVLQSKLFLRGE